MLDSINNRKSSSSKQIDIKKIEDGIVQIGKNKYLSIIRTGSINFELKNETEQDSVIDSYENLLNGLNFPVQILIRTRELEIKEYLQSINELKQYENETIYKNLIEKYSSFIRNLVKDKKIISRHFYIVFGIDSKDRNMSSIKQQLDIKLDYLKRNLNNVGIEIKKLDSLELIDLFHSFYSPHSNKYQPISHESLLALNNEYIRRGNEI